MGKHLSAKSKCLLASVLTPPVEKGSQSQRDWVSGWGRGPELFLGVNNTLVIFLLPLLVKQCSCLWLPSSVETGPPVSVHSHKKKLLVGWWSVSCLGGALLPFVVL